MGRKSPQNQRKNRIYWANSRRITAVQRIYDSIGKREEEEEEEEEEEWTDRQTDQQPYF